MHKLVIASILIVMSFISTAIANNKEENKMSTEENRVMNVIQNMTAAFHSGDIEGVMKSYDKNATVMFEPAKPISDPAVLREMFKGAFSLNPKFTYSGHEVFISGDVAVHFAPWKMKGSTPDGTAIEQSGLSVAVLRRQSNGEWLMVIDNPHGQNLMNKP